MENKMNDSKYNLYGKMCSTNVSATDESDDVLIIESSSTDCIHAAAVSTPEKQEPSHSKTAATETIKKQKMYCNDVIINPVKSISPEKARQIKEEVLRLQKRRFKMSSSREKKSTAQNCKSHSDLKNVHIKVPSPQKYLKMSAGLISPNKLSNTKKAVEIDLSQTSDKEILCSKVATGLNRMEFKAFAHSSSAGKFANNVKDIETNNARSSGITACNSKDTPKHWGSESQSTSETVVQNTPLLSMPKEIIYIDLENEDTEPQEIKEISFSGKDGMFKKESKLSCNGNNLSVKSLTLQNRDFRICDMNERSSAVDSVHLSSCKFQKSNADGANGTELDSSIPGQTRKYNNSINGLPETSAKQEILPRSNKVPVQLSKADSLQKSHLEYSERKPNTSDSINSIAGCSNLNRAVEAQPQEGNSNKGKEQTLNTKKDSIASHLANEHVRVTSVLQHPKKFAVTGIKNGIELVMGAGGSSKKKSPRNKLGKNSPIKALKSPYSKKLQAFQSKKLEVKKSLNFEDSELPEQSENTPILYSENLVRYFMEIQYEVLSNNYNSRLLKDELLTLNSFNCLEGSEQKLYLRMLGRKFTWHRVTEIKYDDILPSIPEVFANLESAGFVTSDFTTVENLEVMLNVLKKTELKVLCKTFRISTNVFNKPDLVQLLLNCEKNQASIGANSTADVLWKRMSEQLGHCIKLCSAHRDVFRRILMLFSLTHQDNIADRDISKLLSLKHFITVGRMVHPSYKMIWTRSIFISRDDMLRYEDAEKMLNDLFECIALKKWDTVCTLGKEAQKCFKELLQDKEKSEAACSLPLFLRRYSPGSVYAYVITQAVEGFRKTKETIQDAVIALRELLDQRIYLSQYRGRWYDTLALILHSHLHKGREAAELILEALIDDAVNDEFQHSLSNRGFCLLRVLKGNATNLKVQLEKVLRQPLKDVPEVTIKAKALNSTLPGYKKIYIEEGTGETTYSSVEELVISRYKMDYPEAIHGEGSPMTTLFGLLFWNVIYHEEVPDVFQTPYQIEPLDLASGEFFANRKEAIDARLHELNECTVEQLQLVVRDIYKQHEGKLSVVNWNRFRNVNQVMNVIKCVGVKVLCKILERFAKDYRNVRKGFPDLILWAPGKSECLFVEVKGQRDRLSVCQKIWLNKLIEFGAKAEVCHVQTTGSKSLRRKSSAALSEENSYDIPTKQQKTEAHIQPELEKSQL